MEIKIRKAEEKDLEDIRKINSDLFKYDSQFDSTLDMNWPFSEQGTKYYSERIKDGFAIVAELDGKIVGYLIGSEGEAHSYRVIKKIAELENMMVLEEYRRKGVGSKLFNAFLEWCKENNFEHVKVEASADNETAINFYRKMGFKDYILSLEKNMKTQ